MERPDSVAGGRAFGGASAHDSEVFAARSGDGDEAREGAVVHIDRGPECPRPPGGGETGEGAGGPDLGVLYAHQRRALNLLRRRNRLLLAWEMGTGKTLPVVLRLNELLRAGKRCLVIAPLSVLGVWLRECQRWAGIEPVVVGGGASPAKRRMQLAKCRDFVLTSYEIARIERAAFERMRFDCVVCDECHRVKRAPNRTSRAVYAIASSAVYRYALSGTPSPNGPLDIHGTMMFLGVPGVPSSRRVFDAQYAIYGMEVAPGIRKIVGYRNLDSLSTLVSSFSDRVEKRDCLDLPERTFETILFVESPAVMRSYHEMRRQLITEISGRVYTAANVLAASRRLQQILGGYCVGLDNTQRIEILADLLEDLPRPLVIWTEHRSEAEGLARRFGAALHHGGLEFEERQRVVDEFQQGRHEILVSTTGSLYEGVSLTRASMAVYYTQSYSLSLWLQSLDRIHRIGQNRHVVVYRLAAKGTIDEKIGRALEEKRSLQEMLLSNRIGELL